jgi:lysine N-acyltransferase
MTDSDIEPREPGQTTTTPGASARRRPGSRPVEPPPAPDLVEPWSATPVTSEDDRTVELVARWMAAPHVARHWQQDWSIDEWRAEIDAQRAHAHSRPWIVAHEGEPVAYVEVYRPAIDVLAGSVTTDAHDLGVHLAVGDPERVGRGVGSAVLRAVGDGLLAADPESRRVLGDPDTGHDAARGAFAKAGYRLVAEVDLPHKRAAVMALERKEEDCP